MGFFSSIGSVLGGAVGSIFGPVGTVVGAGLGSALGGSGSSTADRRYDQQMSLSQQQMQFQQDYVKNAMQWRAEDAKKAGFHPMAALGFSSPQYSGVSFPSIPGDTQSIDPMEFGQSLNYAATKAKDRKQQATMVGLQMRGMELDNEYKQAQIDALKVDTLASSIASNQALESPAAPPLGEVGIIPGQGDSIKITPSELKATGSVGTQAGAPPSVQWYQNPDGSVVRSMSEQAKQVNEEDVVNTLGWHYDNNITPHLVRGGLNNGANPATYAPPMSMLPKGAVGWRPSGYNKFVPVYDYSDRRAYYGPLD